MSGCSAAKENGQLRLASSLRSSVRANWLGIKPKGMTSAMGNRDPSQLARFLSLSSGITKTGGCRFRAGQNDGAVMLLFNSV